MTPVNKYSFVCSCSNFTLNKPSVCNCTNSTTTIVAKVPSTSTVFSQCQCYQNSSVLYTCPKCVQTFPQQYLTENTCKAIASAPKNYSMNISSLSCKVIYQYYIVVLNNNTDASVLLALQSYQLNYAQYLSGVTYSVAASLMAVLIMNIW